MKETGQETFTSAVLIPAGQAIISGGFVGLASGSIAWAADAGNPAALALATGASVAALAWIGLRSGWERRLESVLGVDPQPAPAAAEYAQSIRVEITSEGGHAGDTLDLPGGAERLQTLARGLTEGKPFTVRQWAGGSSGLYSGSEFDQLRGELIRRGLARWKNPHDNRGGATLTAKGAATMRGLANRQPTTGEGLASLKTGRVIDHPHTSTQQKGGL